MFDIFKKAKEHPLKAAIKGNGNVYRITQGNGQPQTVKAEKWEGKLEQYLDLSAGQVFDNAYDAEQYIKAANEEGKLIEKLILRDEFEGFESEVIETEDDGRCCTVEHLGCHVSGICDHE